MQGLPAGYPNSCSGEHVLLIKSSFSLQASVSVAAGPPIAQLVINPGLSPGTFASTRYHKKIVLSF